MSRSAMPGLRDYQKRNVQELLERLRGKPVLFMVPGVRGTTSTPWRADGAVIVLDEPHHRRG